MKYPLISEYEKEVRTKGSSILNLPQRYEFIPLSTTPIKIYKYGSGAFAGVFKVGSLGKHYALRVFLNGGANEDNINRVIDISKSLSKISTDFLCEYQLYQRGIVIKGVSYPVILMEWINGKILNDYVDSILHRNDKISELQSHLVELNKALEKNTIAHGDIQSGNVLVVENAGGIQLKLVDYDAMYIPELSGQKAIETGHSSFQHPKRDKSVYHSHMDRFSFWLILTALEAIKFDKNLWSKDINLGFNDGDNFLFRAKDLQSPNTSPLIKKLRAINQPSLNFYLDKLLSDDNKPSRDKVALFEGKSKITTTYTIEKKTERILPNPKPLKPSGKEKEQKITKPTVDSTVFRIDSDPNNANVFCNNIMLGNTPIELDITQYSNKKIEIAYGNKKKAFFLNPKQKEYKVKLEETNVFSYPPPPPPPPPKEEVNYTLWGVILAVIIVVIAIIISGSTKNNYGNNDTYSTEDYSVDSAALAVVDSALAVEAVEVLVEESEEKLGYVSYDRDIYSHFATSKYEYDRGNYILRGTFLEPILAQESYEIIININGDIRRLTLFYYDDRGSSYTFSDDKYDITIDLTSVAYEGIKYGDTNTPPPVFEGYITIKNKITGNRQQYNLYGKGKL